MTGWRPFGPQPKLSRNDAVLVAGIIALLIGVAVAVHYGWARRSGSAPPQAQQRQWPHLPQIYRYSAEPGFNVGVPLRPMDQDIFAALARDSFRRDELLDLFPDRPYQIKLVGSAAQQRIQFVAIDLHRSGHFDERWELKDGEVDRRTFDRADPTGGITFVLRHGRWLPR